MYDAGEFAPEPEIICPVCGDRCFISEGELSEEFGECQWVCYCCQMGTDVSNNDNHCPIAEGMGFSYN